VPQSFPLTREDMNCDGIGKDNRYAFQHKYCAPNPHFPNVERLAACIVHVGQNIR